MIHTPLVRLLEVILYTLVNSIPYHICMLYNFHQQLRFPLKYTIPALLIPTAIEFTLNYVMVFTAMQNSAYVNLLWSAAYAAFYLFLIKDHPGKVAFVLLMLMNVCNLNIVGSKLLESYLFAELAMQRLHLSNTLTLLICLILNVPLVFLALRKRFNTVLQRNHGRHFWRYLWLVPATFYLMWYNHVYLDGASSLEVATNTHSTVFLIFINCGAFLIYSIVVGMINESANSAELRVHNHQLALQTIQYENLQERIAETRKTNHDLRHHITVMNGYLESGDYENLQNYFRTMMRQIPNSGNISYCQHNTLNLLLAYFGQSASENRIRYTVKMNVPPSLSIPDNDLAVLIGNLVENAVEACSVQSTTDKRIQICGKIVGNQLLFTIDNTYDRPVKKDRTGIYVSSKHSGNGIGIESARAIAKRHSGDITIEQKDGMFCVSVLIKL